MAYNIPGVQIEEISVEIVADRGVIQIRQLGPEHGDADHVVEVDRVRATLLIRALTDLLAGDSTVL